MLKAIDLSKAMLASAEINFNDEKKSASLTNPPIVDFALTLDLNKSRLCPLAAADQAAVKALVPMRNSVTRARFARHIAKVNLRQKVAKSRAELFLASWEKLRARNRTAAQEESCHCTGSLPSESPKWYRTQGRTHIFRPRSDFLLRR